MSNTKHTPGPWQVIIYKYDKDPKEIVTGVGLVTELEEGRHTEQIVDMILPDTDDDYIKEHEAILANAKLIAAAPEMLEALTGKEEDPRLWAVNWLATLLRVCRKQEVYKAIVEDQGGDADSVGTMLMELDNLVISGNAAIKKATE